MNSNFRKFGESQLPHNLNQPRTRRGIPNNPSGAFCNIDTPKPQFQNTQQSRYQNTQQSRYQNTQQSRYQNNVIHPNNMNPYNNPVQNEIYNTMMKQQARQQNEELRIQHQLQEKQRQMYEQQKYLQEQQSSQRSVRYRERGVQNLNRHTNQKETPVEKIRFRRELDSFVEEGNDPYEILRLPEEFTFEDVKKTYRRMALKAHPDKGGDEQQFARITKAFLFIKEEFKKQTMTKDSHQLKQDYKLDMEQMPQVRSQDLSGGRFDIKKFNEIFGDYRVETVNDDGYGSWMVDRTDVREDIDIENKFGERFTNDSFNNAFEEQEVDTKHMQLMKIVEPEPMAISNKLSFTELGGDRPDSFSRSANINSMNGLNYFDYKSAHTQTKLVDPNNVEKRKSYKSVDAYERDRANQNFEMTEEDKRYLKEKDKREILHENSRVERLNRYDTKVTRRFNDVNRLFLTGAFNR
jgi:curved DNA-binding protein CbpA